MNPRFPVAELHGNYHAQSAEARYNESQRRKAIRLCTDQLAALRRVPPEERTEDYPALLARACMKTALACLDMSEISIRDTRIRWLRQADRYIARANELHYESPVPRDMLIPAYCKAMEALSEARQGQWYQAFCDCRRVVCAIGDCEFAVDWPLVWLLYQCIAEVSPFVLNHGLDHRIPKLILDLMDSIAYNDSHYPGD